MKSATHRIVLVLCYVVALSAFAWFAYRGLGYYRTPLIERPRHELYWTFKPGGTLGLRFGIVGATMMVVMLGYSLRKRLRSMRRMGRVSVWLDFHIFLGIAGPLFILLHSSFKVGGLVALSFWSMVAVALSGVAGRFLYSQIPRNRSGDELDLAQVLQLDRQLTEQLTDEFGLPQEEVATLNAIAEQGLDGRHGLFLLLLRVPFEGGLLRWRLHRFRRRFRGLDRSLVGQFAKTLRRKALLRRRIRLWEAIRRLFHHWHVIHKPFAVLMYLFMVVHIVVAWMTGYAWHG